MTKFPLLTIRVLAPGLALTVPVLSAPEAQPIANGLTRTRIAHEPMLKNPVDLSVDVDGSVYVAETARRSTADLDIRNFKDWVTQTLSLRSVEDRRAFYQKELVPGKSFPSAPLKDWNNDGVIDVKDLTVISERIHKLNDSDGDGIMDKSSVFADDFHTDVTGIAAGVFAWRGDVYASIIPDVWKLRDTTGKGVADKREVLLTGFGVHVAYAGHDMHGTTMGPDGKIYWTIGDKGINVVSKEGKRWEAQDMGSLMRCNPDGTGFEIVARGLRNVQQIAFDDYGNVFGVDNDSDAKGEKERFLHIAEDSDTGWRCYYQYRGSKYNPWMEESISVPKGRYQPAYITPPVCNYKDGPAGFARDPGTALNERYRGSFFLTSFPAGVLSSFRAEPDGASFKMTDSHTVDKGPAYVGCSFGPDGALYLADWAGGYPLKEKGGVWKIDDPKAKDSPLRREVATMLKDGPTKISDEELLKRLKHADQRIRRDAHLEFASRPTGVKLLTRAAAEWKEEPLACTHALWGLTRARIFSPDLFKDLVTARAENTRAQAAKWAGESAGNPVPELIPLLRDPSAAVRYRAAIAIGRLHMDQATDDVLAMLEENANRDHWLRHAGVLALCGMNPSALDRAIAHPSPAVRLAAAVVARRTGSPVASTLLSSPEAEVVSEAARAIYDDSSISAAMPALASLLEKNPDAASPGILRAIAANRITADAGSAARLTAFACDTTRPAALRIAALEALKSWTAKQDLDLVDGRWHPLPAADTAIANKAFAAAAKSLPHDKDGNVAKTASATAKALGIVGDAATLENDIADANNADALRIESLAALKRVEPDRFLAIAPALLNDASVEIRKGTAALLASQPAALAYLLEKARKSDNRSERQNAIALIAKSEAPEARALLADLLQHAEASPEIQFDLLEAAAAVPSLKSEADRLIAALAAKGPLGPHLPSLEGGNATNGKQVFETNLAASCTACHRIGESGSNVGPPLTRIGQKGREHILEALVNPQASIAPGFGTMTVTRKDGTVLAGAPKEETAERIVLLLPDGKEQVIAKSDVASQTTPISTMPPMGAILKPAEIRDLIEFLSQLK